VLFIERAAERQIQEAIEQGKFDGLPGRGRPLDLEADSVTPPHLRVANRILKNANVLPDWMQLDREIREERRQCQSLWARMAREYPRRSAAARETREAARSFVLWYARTREAYLQGVRRVNTAILKFNLLAPPVQQPHIPFQTAEELERIARMFPPPEDWVPPARKADEKTSLLRAAAEMEYLADQARRT